jgi:hypothetical protein
MPRGYSLVSYFYKIIALENLCFSIKDRLYIDGGTVPDPRTAPALKAIVT